MSKHEINKNTKSIADWFRRGDLRLKAVLPELETHLA